MVLSPTLTSKQPLRGFSALIVTLPPAALTAASIFAARVLNAPHDLHASMVTAPPPLPLAGFDLAMVLTGLEAGFDLDFGGIFAVVVLCAGLAERRWTEATWPRRSPKADEIQIATGRDQCWQIREPDCTTECRWEEQEFSLLSVQNHGRSF